MLSFVIWHRVFFYFVGVSLFHLFIYFILGVGGFFFLFSEFSQDFISSESYAEDLT